MNYLLTIVVPLYNEEENLLRVETAMLDYLSVAAAKSKILFVNDGSNDGSLAIVQDICARNTDFEYISFEKNCGLSAAIKAGFDYTQTELVG
ncbi:MAG: glycosyltransferase, partial [Leeuwenhoekiella sp.]